MTSQEFLDKYDNKENFTEDKLYRLWINDLFEYDDENIKEIEGEVWGEPDRWNTCVTRVLQIQNRYFMIYAWLGNTECQESYYNIQPEEVESIEKVITVWEPIARQNINIQGKWEINPDGYYPQCSLCHEEPKDGIMKEFCPSCGAKMENARTRS